MTDARRFWTCPACGATNAGELEACLACASPLIEEGSPPVEVENRAEPHDEPEVRYAGPVSRIGAWLIDAILLNAIATLGVTHVVDNNWVEPFSIEAMPLPVAGALSVFAWLYAAGLESSGLQGTLGKRLVGIAVTDRLGERIGFLRATARFFAKLLSALPLGLGFLPIAFNRRRRGLHDWMSGCLVVHRQSREALKRAGGVTA
ncbi:MAG: RDD family protein [Deltaproteobacteria bacterium]|nr:RDD family protein [Deltaproteobacteria bacterium]MBW2396302.1 RDD family protein [Deltaproteobacteria bacterium]